MERLDIHRLAGQAKLLGTLLGIGGALVLNLYKGMKITLPSMNIHLLHNANATATTAQQTAHSDIWGSMLAFLSCASYASWLIFQVKYSCHYLVCVCVCAWYDGEVIFWCLVRGKLFPKKSILD